jgi:hypothetical protein
MEVIHYIDIADKLQLAVNIKLLYDWNPGDNDAEFKAFLSNEQVFKHLAELIQPKSKPEFVAMLILYRRFPRLPDGYSIDIHNFEKLQVATRTYIKDFRKLLYWLSTTKGILHRPALGPLQYLDRTTNASDVNAQKTIMTIFTQGIHGEYGKQIHSMLDPNIVGKLKACIYVKDGVELDNLETYFTLFTKAMTEVFTSFRQSHDLGVLAFGISAVSTPGEGKPANRWIPRSGISGGNREIQEERPRYNPSRVERPTLRTHQQSRMPFDQSFEQVENVGNPNFQHTQSLGNHPPLGFHQHSRMQTSVPTKQQVAAMYAHFGYEQEQAEDDFESHDEADLYDEIFEEERYADFPDETQESETMTVPYEELGSHEYGFNAVQEDRRACHQKAVSGKCDKQGCKLDHSESAVLQYMRILERVSSTAVDRIEAGMPSTSPRPPTRLAPPAPSAHKPSTYVGAGQPTYGQTFSPTGILRRQSSDTRKVPTHGHRQFA